MDANSLNHSTNHAVGERKKLPLHEVSFYIYFEILIILIAAILFYRQLRGIKPREVDVSEKESRQAEIGAEIYTYKFQIIPAVAIAFFARMLSGFFGIGGGAIMVPVMLLVFGPPILLRRHRCL
ncbi:Sulfite exporter TauE/SafE [Oceanobacillus oncorhynchi]|uniref:Probable membrane transporter protein n=1 Tax=Oceanobacillus oncorhynchi TaxID=545501 RepID=A0A0A1M837_9BACI|nr:TSUP family transporter [Oceanobacillus oncorhynchi]CEI81470.1 Sulfite exporter TauE/SafE [Oceanobacillus oncorhynchi]